MLTMLLDDTKEKFDMKEKFDRNIADRVSDGGLPPRYTTQVFKKFFLRIRTMRKIRNKRKVI
jgi:hypothetical protein